jgi:5S rRNA maturation endonuclease (ribonuclease M5)
MGAVPVNSITNYKNKRTLFYGFLSNFSMTLNALMKKKGVIIFTDQPRL